MEVNLLGHLFSVVGNGPRYVLRVDKHGAFMAQSCLCLNEFELVLLAKEGNDEIEIALAHKHNCAVPASLQSLQELVQHVLVENHVAHGPFQEEEAFFADLVDAGRGYRVLDVPAVDPPNDNPALLGQLPKDDVGHAKGNADHLGKVSLPDGMRLLVPVDAFEKRVFVVGQLLRVQTMNTIYQKEEKSTPFFVLPFSLWKACWKGSFSVTRHSPGAKRALRKLFTFWSVATNGVASFFCVATAAAQRTASTSQESL